MTKEWKKGDICWINNERSDPDEALEVKVSYLQKVGGRTIIITERTSETYTRSPEGVYETEREAKLARARTMVEQGHWLVSQAENQLELAQKKSALYNQKLADLEKEGT